VVLHPRLDKVTQVEMVLAEGVLQVAVAEPEQLVLLVELLLHRRVLVVLVCNLVFLELLLTTLVEVAAVLTHKPPVLAATAAEAQAEVTQ
jgi:hypothetical protein